MGFHETFILGVDLSDLLRIETHESLGLILLSPSSRKMGLQIQWWLCREYVLLGR